MLLLNADYSLWREKFFQDGRVRVYYWGYFEVAQPWTLHTATNSVKNTMFLPAHFSLVHWKYVDLNDKPSVVVNDWVPN